MSRVGDEVDVLCGRCKIERSHTVAALGEDGRIESVVCNYCHTPHKYHTPAGSKSRTSKAGAPRARKLSAADEDDGRPGRPYSTQGTYDKGDVLEHAKYGRGRVVEVRGGKIDVRFSDGFVRVFVHVAPPSRPDSRS
ncbi:MAG: hypothetical protein U0166_01775 [Acidobacteriota bacterium]